MDLRDDAWEAVKKAVEIWQDLATGNPDVFKGDLDGALELLSHWERTVPEEDCV